MTSRQGAFSSDAVGIITGQGDRLDKLERTFPPVTENNLDASYWPITTIPGNGDPTRVGTITVPRGFSRLTVAAFFNPTAGGDTLNGLGIIFPPGWEGEHVLIGGFTETDGGSGMNTFRASGVALLRSSRRHSGPFYVGATTGSGSPAVSSGVLFIEPVGSIVAG